MTVLEELNQAKAEIISLNEKLAGIPALNEKIAALEKDSAAARNDFVGAVERTNAAEANVKKLTAEKAELAGKVEIKEGEVEKRAAVILAGVGHTAAVVTTTESPEKKTGNQLDTVREQLAKETDPEKRAELAKRARELRGHGDIFKQ